MIEELSKTLLAMFLFGLSGMNLPFIFEKDVHPLARVFNGFAFGFCLAGGISMLIK